jgi:hypothetical protein
MEDDNFVVKKYRYSKFKKIHKEDFNKYWENIKNDYLKESGIKYDSNFLTVDQCKKKKALDRALQKFETRKSHFFGEYLEIIQSDIQYIENKPIEVKYKNICNNSIYDILQEETI